MSDASSSAKDGDADGLRSRVQAPERSDRERGRAEQTLKQAHANLLALLENTDNFILFSDRSGSPLFFNSAYAKLMRAMLGIEMRPGIKPHALLPDPQARAMWDEFHRRVLSGERFSVEFDHSTPDGEVRHFEVRYNPVLEGDRIVGFSEFSRDITDRKRADVALREARDRLEREVAERTEELRASESRFRGLTERSADVTMIADRNGVCSYASPSVRKYGYDPEKIVGKTPESFAHPEDLPRIAEAYRRASEEPGLPILLKDVRTRTSDGDYVVLDGTITAHFDVPGIDGLVLNMRDVTERLQLETRLRHSEKMDAIGQLAGGVAHDFNNQLTGILAHADLLVSRLDDATQRGWAEQIAQAALRSADLTGKLLAFARKGQYRSDVVEVGELLSEVAELLGHSIDKRIRIEVDLVNGPLRTVGDPSLLQNAFLNLGLNARDAMPNGGTLMLRASRHCVDPDSAFPHAVSPGDYLCVSVSDDGEGMDDATQARIFEPFFTTKAPGKGTGMGLASVYGTVRSHGGSISVVSAPGAGSTFEILLPETKSTRVPTTRLRHTEPATRPLKILIVDDEPVIRRVLSRLLETLGHTPSMCVDGVDAVDHYRQFGSTIDLVILDMVMPRQGGRDTFFALRQINPAVRVLISSGFTVEGGAQTLLTHGAAGFLQKPFALERLAEAIEHARR